MTKMCLRGRLWPQLASYVPLAMWANIESNNLRCPSNQFARQLPHFAALPSCFYVGSIQFKVQLETARIRLFLTVAKLLSNSSLAALPPAQHRNLFAIPGLFQEANFSATLWTFKLTSLWETDNNLSGVFHVNEGLDYVVGSNSDEIVLGSLRALHPQALKADAPLTKKNPQSSILRAEVVKKTVFWRSGWPYGRGGVVKPHRPWSYANVKISRYFNRNCSATWN